VEAARVPNCPICESNSTLVEHEGLFDDRYGFPGDFDVAKCVACEHRFSLPKLSETDISKVYEYYGRRSTRSGDITDEANKSARTTAIQRFFAGTNNLGQHFAPSGSRILDVGSGDCSNLLESTILGFDSVGFDVDSESQRLGTELGLNVQVATSTKDIDSTHAFSWIQLNQVVEHFIDPVSQLRALSLVLQNSGKVFIATPNVSSLARRLFSRKWINWHVPYHQHHFSKASLEILAQRSGLEIESWQTVTPNVWSKIQVANLFERQMKGAPSNLWRNDGMDEISPLGKLMRKTANFGSLVLSPLTVAALRFVDLIGMGDCHVIILKGRT
jgi:2-polyprenyl-3-methyl-5-hydroxy-6-metoxy-1,4-benzoquinol methylase